MSQDDRPTEADDPWFDDLVRRARERDHEDQPRQRARIDPDRRRAMLAAIGVESRPAPRRSWGRAVATHGLAMAAAAVLAVLAVDALRGDEAREAIAGEYLVELAGGRAERLGPDDAPPTYRLDDTIVLVARPRTQVRAGQPWTVDVHALPIAGGPVRSTIDAGTVGAEGRVEIEAVVADLVGPRPGTFALELAIGPRGSCRLGEEQSGCLRTATAITVVSP